MAIPVPTSLDLLAANALIGNVPAGEEPLATLGERSNWHYASHAPALVNVSPYSEMQTTSTYTIPIRPSADGLDYDVVLAVWTYFGSIEVELWTSTNGVSYSSVSGWAPNTIATGLATDQIACLNFGGTYSSEPAATIPGNALYLQVIITHADARDVQLLSVCVFPQRLTSIAAGAKSSGFVPWEAAHLASSGAAIHTEYLNRLAANVHAVQADRWQWLTGWVQENAGPLRLTGSTAEPIRLLFLGAVTIPLYGVGQTVTIIAKASDSGTAYLYVGQRNGESVIIDADGAFHVETIDLTEGDVAPVLYCSVQPDSGTDVEFVAIMWEPQLGSSSDICAAVAPDPKIEYLALIDDLQLRGCADPYAGVCHHFDWENGGNEAGIGDHWNMFQTLAPGTRAVRPIVTRSPDTSSSAALDDAEVYGDDDGQPSQWADVAAPPGGDETYPPTNLAQVVWGSVAYDASPAAGGDERELLVDEELEPQCEWFRAAHCIALSFLPDRVADLHDL